MSQRKNPGKVLRKHFSGDGEDKVGFFIAAVANDDNADIGRNVVIYSGGGGGHGISVQWVVFVVEAVATVGEISITKASFGRWKLPFCYSLSPLDF